MKLHFYVTSLTCTILLGCNSTASKKDIPSSTLNDSFAAATANNSYREEYITQYNQPINVDTNVQLGQQTYRLQYSHTCNWDSALLIPAFYNLDTKKEFRTHQFSSSLTLLQKSDTIFHQKIGKKLFDPILDTVLTKYATLLYPALTIQNNAIHIHYSISIPATDIGIGAQIQFDKNGNYSISQ